MKNLTGYFLDKRMNVLGLVSSTIPNALRLESDNEFESIEEGTTIFEGVVSYYGADEAGSDFVKVGNYFLYEDEEGVSKAYTIIDTEKDRKRNEISFYAEDAGLSLLNSYTFPYEAVKDMTIASYFELFLKGSGFEIGTNELGDAYSRKLKWEGNATITERLLSVATQFDHADINFSFVVKGMRVTEKYVNIYKKRGIATNVTLQLNREIDNIITSESIKNLATSVLAKGGTPEGQDKPITLKGYVPKVPDERFFIEGEFLRDRDSNEIWSSFLSEGEGAKGGYIEKPFDYDTLSKEELYNRSVNHLKRVSQIEQNFEVDIALLPDNVRIGDTIQIVDQEDNLYLQARVLKMDKSRSLDKYVATLGEYLIKESGINQRLQELADRIATIPRGATDYLWIRYADDDKGNGFSASPTNKVYMAIKHVLNQPVPSDDPKDYEGLWVLIQGEKGIPGEPGDDGLPTYTWIRYADNVSGGGISANPDKKMYIGFAYNKPTPTPSNIPKDYAWLLAKGEDGKNGLSITSVQSLFYQSTSATSLVGGTWVTIAPTWESGKFSWTKTKTVFSDSTSSETTPVNITGGIGEDGKPTYTWLMYAENDKGKGISASPVGKYFIGFAYNKAVEKPSTVAKDYTWSAMYDEEKMAELQKQIDNIQVGGTNMIRDSAFDEEFAHYPTAQKGWSVDTDTKFMGQNTAKFQWESGVNNYPYFSTEFVEARISGFVGNEMTFSVYIFIPDDAILSDAPYLEVAGYENTSQTTNAPFKNGRITIPADTKKGVWQRFTTTFIVEDSTNNGKTNFMRALLRNRANNSPTTKDKFWYALPQLEFGNKVTPWSKATADTPSTGDLSNVQTELQKQLNTIVMPATQPNAPRDAKEGMVWWQNNLAGEIIGMFKYEKGKWEPQTIQQSMLNIIELNAIRITGSNITGTEISGSTLISAFDNSIVQGSPIRRRGTLTLDKGYALIKYEQYDENSPSVVINKGESRMDEYGISTILRDKNDNELVSSQYGPLGININDRSKPYGSVNLGYSDLINIPLKNMTPYFAKGWDAYSTEYYPQIYRAGKNIQIFGAMKPYQEVAGGAVWQTVMTLPPEYRPLGIVGSAQQGSLYNTFAFQILKNGEVQVSRHRNKDANAIPFAPTNWVNVAFSYITS